MGYRNLESWISEMQWTSYVHIASLPLIGPGDPNQTAGIVVHQGMLQRSITTRYSFYGSTTESLLIVMTLLHIVHSCLLILLELMLRFPARIVHKVSHPQYKTFRRQFICFSQLKTHILYTCIVPQNVTSWSKHSWRSMCMICRRWHD